MMLKEADLIIGKVNDVTEDSYLLSYTYFTVIQAQSLCDKCSLLVGPIICLFYVVTCFIMKIAATVAVSIKARENRSLRL